MSKILTVLDRIFGSGNHSLTDNIGTLWTWIAYLRVGVVVLNALLGFGQE